jgi:hypothetical protein
MKCDDVFVRTGGFHGICKERIRHSASKTTMEDLGAAKNGFLQTPSGLVRNGYDDVRWTELAKSSVRKYATVQQITVINVGDK